MNVKITRVLTMGSLIALGACAPKTGGNKATPAMSPRSRAAAQAQQGGTDTGGVTETKVNATAAAAPAAATSAESKSAVPVQAKCRLSDNSNIPADQASIQPICTAIVVTPSDAGEIKLAGLMLQDNASAPVDMTSSDTKCSSDNSALRSCNYASDTEVTKNKDGQGNVLHLSYMIPDQASQIDQIKNVSVSSDGKITTVLPESDANRNSGLSYSLAQSKNTGRAVVQLLMGSLEPPPDASAGPVPLTNSPLPNINFVVTISYTLKSAPASSAPAAAVASAATTPTAGLPAP